ncbi:MAG: T9SS type A sorting domain-containing protein [Bacteroidetes bacterium]|nr:T9SS type A sorting domain-containing protein [Bacteroidota bacterium]
MDDNYYVSGVTAGTDTNQYIKALFGKTLSNGSSQYINGLIDTLPYSYQCFWNTLNRTSDGNFVICGEMIDTMGKIFIAKIDTNGHVMFIKDYPDTTWLLYHAQNVIEIPGIGFMIAVNVAYPNNNSAILLITTDTVGNLLQKKIHDLNTVEFPWIIRKTISGTYMIGAVTRKSNTNTPFWAKTWLLEVDSMGNYVNQWLDNDNKNKWPYGMQQTADSGWIIVRQHLAYDVAGLQLYNASVIKLDKNFTKEWEVIKGDSGFDTGLYDVEILQDGKYIVCGTTPEWGTDSAHHFGWILKIDTDGTILWERKYVAYERFGTYSFLYDIDVLPNGDLLACGELRFTFNVGITPIQQGWILRTDSNGCVIENCILSSPLTREEESAIQVWPNPASNYVIVSLENEMLHAELKVFDVTGKLMIEKNVTEEQTAIDVSDLNRGMYLMIAEKQGMFARVKMVVE